MLVIVSRVLPGEWMERLEHPTIAVTLVCLKLRAHEWLAMSRTIYFERRHNGPEERWVCPGHSVVSHSCSWLLVALVTVPAAAL